jgi:hypothetical protein
MRRRQFLASVPLAAGLAGCGQLSGPSSETPQDSVGSETPDESTGSQTLATGAGDGPRSPRTATPVSETAAVVRPAYRHRFSADAFRFVRPDRAQFLFASVPAASTDQYPSSFELAVGDRRFEVADIDSGPPHMLRMEELHTVREPSGWVGFDVPRVEADEATLVGPNHEYRLPPEAVADLSGVPDLVVESVSAPDRVASDGAARVEVTVRNAGDRRGVFLGGFQRGGVPSLLAVEVDPGETGLAVRTFEPYESGRIALEFRHPRGRRDIEIDVVGTDTP